jgi:predicted MPP superfamily phosphohydrolase
LRENAPGDFIDLVNVFPALKVALAEHTRWPGVLVWTPRNDAAFFELSFDRVENVYKLGWLFTHLASALGQDLTSLRADYDKVRTPVGHTTSIAPLRILHLSDIHLGHPISRSRLEHLKDSIRTVVRELSDTGPVLPVVTGDLMDTPSEDNVSLVRSFTKFLADLGKEKPVIVLGNHDVRKDGWGPEDYSQAVKVQEDPSVQSGRVVWIEKSQVGLIRFSSVSYNADAAAGRIGDLELRDAEQVLTRDERSKTFKLVALVHHHPTRVQTPTWYRAPLYERVFGPYFNKLEALENSQMFVQWLRTRGVVAVLHGHKHVPRFDLSDDLSVIGCGSSVGLVETENPDETYMSLNVVTIDSLPGIISCRLLFTRTAGGVIESQATNEMVFRKLFSSANRLGIRDGAGQ